MTELTTHFYVTCRKCGNDKAYSWYDKRHQCYRIRCDNCGVYCDE